MILKIGAGAGAFGASIVAIRDVMLSGSGATNNPVGFIQSGCLQIVLYAIVGALLGLVVSLIVPAVARLLTRRHTYEAYVPGGLFLILAGVMLLLVTPSPHAEETPALYFALVVSVLLAVGGAFLVVRVTSNGNPDWVPIGAGTMTGATILFVGVRAQLVSILPSSVTGYVGIAVGGLAAALVAYWIVARVQQVLASRWSQPRAAWGLTAVIGAIIVVFALGTMLPSGSGDAGALDQATVSGDTSRSNVILISVDTLRADYVGYAGGPARTPNLDAFAEESFVFENAYSVAPWTRPSFASFFSSRYPSEMGVARALEYSGEGTGSIPFQWRRTPNMLAELMKASGYSTRAVATNPHLAPASNAKQGFTSYKHSNDGYGLPVYQRPDWVPLCLQHIFGKDRVQMERASQVHPLMIRELDGIDTASNLGWVHSMDPHAPYAPPTLSPEDRWGGAGSTISPKEPQQAIDAYIAEVEYWDRWFGKLIQSLRDQNLLDNSIVIVWSDHGEEFSEHGGWGHGHTLYEELLRVPLLIRLPGQTDNVQVNDWVSLLDITPTILQLCEISSEENMRGRSLVPLLNGRPDELVPLSVFVEGCASGSIRKGLIRNKHKLIYDVQQDYFRLYDLQEDPEEQHNIYGLSEAPPEIASMENDLRSWTENSLAVMSHHLKTSTGEELPPEVRQQLKDMGYVQ